MKFDVNSKKISSRVLIVLLEEYSIIQSFIQHTLRSKISRVVENLFHFTTKLVLKSQRVNLRIVKKPSEEFLYPLFATKRYKLGFSERCIEIT